MEQKLHNQSLVHDEWVATENIARFERLMNAEPDTCHRKSLGGLLVLEQQKLRDLLARHWQNLD